MAERNPLHQPNGQLRRLETGGQPFDPPLLPYEVALIQALGCSEQEYREFVRHAQLKAQTRPAEYDVVPEVVNGPVLPIVINLVIGLALTALSTLLAPKATFQTPAKIRGRRLADQIGPARFNQTTSFDNVGSLAEYGQPIPIPFGKRGTGADGVITGGLILAPALVWSRVYSYGTYQAYEGIYVAGEYGVAAPQLGGIRFGTTALNSLGNREYALYWSSILGNNRPASTNLIAGTEGPGATGTSGRLIFTAPTDDGEFSNGFSMAYNPQSGVFFGTSDPIHNGSAFRFNWEIVSAPYDGTIGSDNKQEREEMQARRRKIAGSLADVLHDDNEQRGMPGVGRAYSRRMGFIAHTPAGGSRTEYENRTIVPVGLDDVLEFEINGTNWKELQQREPDDPDGGGFKGTEVNVKDLKTSADTWRARAADLLTIGSKWVITGSTWVVESRSAETWKPGTTMTVFFRCTSTIGVAEVGIPGTRTVREPLGGYEGQEFNPNKHCGAAFYNICRLNMASIRPVRRDAEVIEIGIRSQVWNRANGLCNFNVIPTPQKLYRLDKKNITLNTPRMDKYFERTSCFSIWVRPVQEYGQPQEQWRRIPQVFCVTGNSPVDQFNAIRIRPRESRYFEYRFIPRTGSDIAINSIDTNIAIRLNSNISNVFATDYTTPYGNFRITVKGEQVAIADIRFNDELLTDPVDFREETLTQTNIPSSLAQTAISSSNGSDVLIRHAWLTTFFGYARDNKGKTVSVDYQHYKENGDRYITIRIIADSNPGTLGVTVGPKYVAANGGDVYFWDNIRYQVVTATGEWAVGDAFTILRNTNNDFSNYEGKYSSVSYRFDVTATRLATTEVADVYSGASRVFEENSQVSDCSHYLELTKSNENGPEHEIIYVNECISNETPAEYYALSTMALSIKSSGQVSSIGQIRAWVPTGINVYRLIEQDTNPSNLFADLVYYLLTSKSQGVGNIIPVELVDVEALTITARYLQANRIFFDTVIEDSESLRSYIYDNAALQLCNFTVKNGRFGLMPALPYDANYQISAQPVQAEQIFTAGNIIEDTLNVQYIDVSSRTYFRAVVNWRVTVENDLPTSASAVVDWADIPAGLRATTQQTFDLSEFCTNRAQALLTARFLLSTRRRVTHTITFKTIPDALGIQPGSYIRVITTATTYNATANGAITDAGTLVTISTIEDGTYNAVVYNPATSEVKERNIVITNNTVSDTTLFGCLFTLLSTSTNKGMYQVEQLTLDDDGLVNVSAVEVPVDDDGVSMVVKDVLNPSAFRILE